MKTNWLLTRREDGGRELHWRSLVAVFLLIVVIAGGMTWLNIRKTAAEAALTASNSRIEATCLQQANDWLATRKARDGQMPWTPTQPDYSQATANKMSQCMTAAGWKQQH